MKAQQNKRISNIELLRIIAMLMIICHHFVKKSSIDFSSTEITFNRLWCQLFQMGGKIGSNVFVIITGYFSVNKTSRKLEKAFGLWLQTSFYSIGFYVLYLIFNDTRIVFKDLLVNLFPITYSRYWFMSAYFVLYLLIPYINKLLQNMNKSDYSSMLILLMFCWCIVPTFLGTSWQSNNLLWFVFLYLVGGYIKMNLNVDRFNTKICIIGIVLLTILLFLSTFVFDIIGIHYQAFATHSTYFFYQDKIPVFVLSVLIFIVFLKLNIGTNKIINMVSSTTLGIYLIHDNYYFRNFLWEKIFKVSNFSESIFFPLYSIGVVLIVFAFCSFFELLRINLFERKYMKLINKLSEYLKKRKIAS